MTFDETIATLRQWIGDGVSISLTHDKHGPADGYLADFSGRLTRVDEPITGVDAPVFYSAGPTARDSGCTTISSEPRLDRASGGGRRLEVV
jgi:hypothetical protein